jgi:hypothetical protein
VVAVGSVIRSGEGEQLEVNVEGPRKVGRVKVGRMNGALASLDMGRV